MNESTRLLQKNREYGYLLTEIFAVLDGERLPCEDCNERDLQNAYYKGYTCSFQVTNLLVCNFKGEIAHAEINFPGSSHDNKVAYASDLI